MPALGEGGHTHGRCQVYGPRAGRQKVDVGEIAELREPGLGGVTLPFVKTVKPLSLNVG